MTWHIVRNAFLLNFCFGCSLKQDIMNICLATEKHTLKNSKNSPLMALHSYLKLCFSPYHCVRLLLFSLHTSYTSMSSSLALYCTLLAEFFYLFNYISYTQSSNISIVCASQRPENDEILSQKHSCC